jgi:hypothetical protein
MARAVETEQTEVVEDVLKQGVREEVGGNIISGGGVLAKTLICLSS